MYFTHLKYFRGYVDRNEGNEGEKFVLRHDYALDKVRLMFGAKIEAFLEEFPLRRKMGFVPFRM